ncbi:MAG: glycerophosphodiester phosphodiesterase, partial [Clostridia bacterium]|nr:glycerophosphodiester phosphodiesterase [Clostridia bacterium]
MEKQTSWLTKTVVAHRGLHDNKTLPENSLGAFENAIQRGYGIEFDVWRTNDGTLIVHHDPKLKRTCLRDGKVTDVDTSRLEEYKLMNTQYSI